MDTTIQGSGRRNIGPNNAESAGNANLKSFGTCVEGFCGFLKEI